MPELTVDEMWLIVALAAVAGFLLGRQSAASGAAGGMDAAEQAMRRDQFAEEAFSRLSPNTQDEIDRLVTNGQAIDAIKVVRSDSGYGLREAKIIVDHRRHMLSG